jgi:hypothetical protein
LEKACFWNNALWDKALFYFEGGAEIGLKGPFWGAAAICQKKLLTGPF